MTDKPEGNIKHSYAGVFAVFLAAFISSSCRGEVKEVPTPTPSPSRTPTTIFADLPPLNATFGPESTTTPVAFVTSTPAPGRTTQPTTPALSPSLIPTTPDNRWEACENSPLSDLHVGDRAYTSYDPYLPTRVRTQPSLFRSGVLGLIIPGELVEILEGPSCADGAVWWKVSSFRKDLQGWVQEGDEERNWLIRTERDSGIMVPPPPELLCPVNDESFCVFVYALEPLVSRGEFEQILAHTRVSECVLPGDANSSSNTPMPEDMDTSCVYLAVIGRGLGGAALTSTALIEPGWASYASPPRKIAALLLPPFEEVQPAVPPNPALLIETGDPLWDWLFFIENMDGAWQIYGLAMLSRESDAYFLLVDDPIRWP